MKKSFILAIMAITMMTSCRSLYVQTVNIKSADTNSSEAYKYNDEAVTISYNFFAENGDPGFVFTNNTDSLIYVDLSKSFLVIGSEANDYYRARTVSSSSVYTEILSTTRTSTAVGRWFPANVPGAISTSITGGVKHSVAKGVEFNEKPIVAIPAHTYKQISEYTLCSEPFQDCSVKMHPGAAGATYKFAENEMPEFTNVITYRIGDKGHDVIIRNKFKITGFKNQRYKDATEKIKIGCKKVKRIDVFKHTDPMSFYIRYNSDTNNDYSADARSF